MIESTWKSMGKSDCFKAVDCATSAQPAAQQPRLVIDVENEEVVLDGHHYQPGRKTILILDVLFRAKGQPVDRPQIRKGHPELELEEHPERPIKRLWKDRGPLKALGKAVEQEKHGFYRIRPDYL